MATAILCPKLPGETVDVVCSFLSRLFKDEIVLAATTNVTVDTGVDSAPLALLVGGTTVESANVTQKITGGIPGVVYKLWMAARTDKGNILVQELKLAIEAAPVLSVFARITEAGVIRITEDDKIRILE